MLDKNLEPLLAIVLACSGVGGITMFIASLLREIPLIPGIVCLLIGLIGIYLLGNII